MNKFKIFTLLILFILSMASVSAQESNANAVITLERTPCFGTCPVYTVTIYDDGTVVYNGENFVEVTGEQTSEIDPELVASTVKSFEDAGYFEWDEAYTTQTVSDLPTVITSVTHDGETHRIERYVGDSAPLALPYLEQWIDRIANTQQWTGVYPDIANIANGTDSPLITLQREPCFGMCPIYNVALYADGTIIFTGIDHVNEVGVHVSQTEEFSVSLIAEQAKSFGYFDWQDRYDTMFMTDQAYVTTSIFWEDTFKQITRYLGDPTAPVGLVWIEESIDQLIADWIG